MARRYSVALPGLAPLVWRNRWLAPPANFRQPSGLKRQTHTASQKRHYICNELERPDLHQTFDDFLPGHDAGEPFLRIEDGRQPEARRA
jgi:hypothetical protein